ncbi:zinc finger SWIM domain-containing protein 7-like [Contarinia nasturtii]|uniref:zinc finger SWIM domain-containing protein 7-like n=1 Tax=Contarinia nasturtii TaxID=265458 RepID=UPI0012D45FD3|nr:zinc finger SWIM domain-containing protein 7-like [Contarinia nasturtii]
MIYKRSRMELEPSPLAIAVNQIFERLEHEYSLRHLPQFADKDLLELNGIFGTLLAESLDLLDREKITIHRRASDNREYFEIIEDQNSVYKLLPNLNYCMCKTFRDKVLNTNELYTCKHVLASRLCVLIGKVKVETKSDDAFIFSLQLIRPMSTIVADE